MNSIQITLPWPPSVNAYWRAVNGRNILSEKGRAYKVSAESAIVLAGYPRHSGPCRVSIALYPPDNRRRDCDNTLKPILDALVSNGVIESDDYRIVRGITVNWANAAASKATAGVRVVIGPAQQGEGA